MSSFVAALLTVAMVAGVAFADDPPAQPSPGLCEANDAPNIETADAPALNGPACAGVLGMDDNADWFTVALKRGQHLYVTLAPNPPLLAARLVVKDPFSVPSNALCANGNQTNTADSCDLVVQSGGAWRIGVVRESGEGSYRITSAATPAQDDCGSKEDAAPTTGPGAPLNALAVEIPATGEPGTRRYECAAAAFDNDDERDAFVFPGFPGQTIAVTTTDAVAAPQPTVGGVVLRAPGGQETSGTTSLVAQANEEGLYVLEIARGTAWEKSGYSFAIDVTQNDCDEAGDVSNDKAAPFALTGAALRSCAAALDVIASPDGTLDAADWYSMKADPGTPVSLGVDSSAGQCHKLSVYRNVNAAPLKTQTTCDGAAPAVYTPSTTEIDKGGTWFLSVTNGAPEITLDAFSLAFGRTVRSTKGATIPVVVTANSNATIKSISVRGVDTKDFALDSACSNGLLRAGTSCDVPVTFRPLGLGPRAAQLAITTEGPTTAADDDITRIAALAGEGTQALLQFVPTAFDFGDATYGSPTAPQSVTITNVSSDSALSIGTAFTSGANAGDFRILADPAKSPRDTCSGRILASGGSCSVPVVFDPRGNGDRSATLVIPNDGGTAAELELSGVGHAPVISVTPAALAFPPTAIGNRSSLEVTVRNTGTATLRGNIAQSFTSTEFSVPSSGNTCRSDTSTLQIAAGAACSFSVVFAPAGTPGTRTQLMRVSGNAPQPPVEVDLTATALAGTNCLSVASPDDGLNFGTRIVKRGASKTRAVQVRNCGTNAVTMRTTSTGDLGSFKITDACANKTLSPDATCSMPLQFDPQIGGALVVDVSIRCTVTCTGAAALRFRGVGQDTGGLLDVSCAAFGPETVGATSARRTCTVRNIGTAAVTLERARVLPEGEFTARSNACTPGLALKVEETCAVDVTFSPSHMGARSAVLLVESDEPDHANRTVMNAIGLAPLITATSTAPGASMLESVRAFAVTVRNTGTAPLTISKVTLSNDAQDFLVATDDCTASARDAAHMTIPADGSCKLSMLFVPREIGERTATLRIDSDADTVAPVLALSGIGRPHPSLTLGKGGAYNVLVTGVHLDPPAAPKDCGLVPDASGDVTAPTALSVDGTTASCGGAILANENDKDFYSVPVAATDIVHVIPGETVAAGIVLCQYDASGTPVGAHYDRDGETILSCDLDHRVAPGESAGRWTIGVSGPASAYDFSVQIVKQTDCGHAGDLANSLDEARAAAPVDLTVPLACIAPVSGADLSDKADGRDVLRLTTGAVSRQATLVVTMTPDTAGDVSGGADFDVLVYDFKGDLVATSGVVRAGAGQPEVVVANCDNKPTCGAEGIWFVEVRAVRGKLGPYKLTITGRSA